MLSVSIGAWAQTTYNFGESGTVTISADGKSAEIHCDPDHTFNTASQDIYDAMANVENVTFDASSVITGTDLTPLREKMQKVKKIDMTGAKVGTTSDFYVGDFPALEELVMDNMDLNNTLVEISTCPTLKKISMKGATNGKANGEALKIHDCAVLEEVTLINSEFNNSTASFNNCNNSNIGTILPKGLSTTSSLKWKGEYIHNTNQHFGMGDWSSQHFFNEDWLMMSGNMNQADIDKLSCVSKLNDEVGSLRMLDVTLADDVTSFPFKNLSKVKNIILPKGVEKVKESWFEGTIGLNAAVSYDESASPVFLSAYVHTEGTLIETMIRLQGFNPNGVQGISNTDLGNNGGFIGTYGYNIGKVKKLTLSGNLNAKDLAGSDNFKCGSDGHLTFTNPTHSTTKPYDDTNWGIQSRGLAGDAAYGAIGNALITSLDLSDAHFSNEIDMTLAAYSNGTNYSYISSLVLPKTATKLPADFINNCASITKLCIPGTVKTIETRAFYGTNISVITTTDANGVEYGYTAGGVRTTDISEISKTLTFPAGLEKVETMIMSTGYFKHVFVMNPVAPECEVNAFNTITYVANNTLNNPGGVVTIDSYKNDDGNAAVLHFPTECNSNGELVNYTDPTRDYSIASEDRDARGNIIMYPNQVEMNRAFVQGTTGYLWSAQENERNINGDAMWFSDDEEMILKYSNEKDVAYYEGIIADKIVYTTDDQGYRTHFADKYRGWHQFVLTAYTSGVPENVFNFGQINDNEWWTMCYPFPLTAGELRQYFGGAGDPIVCEFTGVDREVNKVIRLRFGKDLVAGKGDDEYVTVAGHPYMIKPNLKADVTADERILHAPVGYLDAGRFAKKTSAEMEAMLQENLVIIGPDKIKVTGDASKNGNTSSYTFIGSFWRWGLPQHCYFLGWNSRTQKVQFFYHDTAFSAVSNDWNTCTAIICPNWKTSAGFYNPSKPNSLETVHWNVGSDFCQDDSFVGGFIDNSAGAKYQMLFGDETTAINTIHMGNGTYTSVTGKIYNANGQLMNQNGNTDNLPKGIYIVGGKKYVK